MRVAFDKRFGLRFAYAHIVWFGAVVGLSVLDAEQGDSQGILLLKTVMSGQKYRFTARFGR